MLTRLSYPLPFRHRNFLKKSPQRRDCSATVLCRTSRQPSSPLSRPASSRATPCPVPCSIHFAHRRRRDRGGLRLCGRKGRHARCAWGVRWTVTLDVPLTRAYWPPRSPLGRLWPPTTLCFKCFRRFRLMFQVFHLNVANRSRCCKPMFQVFQMYVSSVSFGCCIC
jgi:hypothetical protein